MNSLVARRQNLLDAYSTYVLFISLNIYNSSIIVVNIIINH